MKKIKPNPPQKKNHGYNSILTTLQISQNQFADFLDINRGVLSSIGSQKRKQIPQVREQIIQLLGLFGELDRSDEKFPENLALRAELLHLDSEELHMEMINLELRIFNAVKKLNVMKETCEQSIQTHHNLLFLKKYHPNLTSQQSFWIEQRIRYVVQLAKANGPKYQLQEFIEIESLKAKLAAYKNHMEGK